MGMLRHMETFCPKHMENLGDKHIYKHCFTIQKLRTYPEKSV